MAAFNRSHQEYWKVKSKLIEELKQDLSQSNILKLNVNGQRAPLDTCTHYQRKNCGMISPHNIYTKLDPRSTHRKSENTKQDKLVYHICDFCYELLNEVNEHQAAECTILKRLDDEFKDYDTNSNEGTSYYPDSPLSR